MYQFLLTQQHYDGFLDWLTEEMLDVL